MNMLLKRFHTTKLNVIGHSFGTVICSTLLNTEFKEKIDKIVMIEPVCFFNRFQSTYRYIHNPKYSYNMLLSWFVGYTVYSDIYVKYITERHINGPDFWIYDYNEMNSNNILLILSEKDEIVTTEPLIRMMKKHNINHIVLEDSNHADLFMTEKYKHVIEQIVNYLK